MRSAAADACRGGANAVQPQRLAPPASPIRISGLSAASEPWDTMPRSLPRSCASRRGEALSRSSPLNRTEPPVARAAGGSRRAIAETVSVLPDPDSPTSPIASP